MSSAAPSARRTYDGSSEADVHALPEDSAISYRKALAPHIATCMGATYLQRHQQTLPLDVSETEIDATGVTVDVDVPNYVFNAGVDAVDEAVRELFHPSMVPLSRIHQLSDPFRRK